MFHSVSLLSQAPLARRSRALPSILLETVVYLWFSHPYISFFHLLVNGFSVIREYDSTLYVGLARAVSPTNTNFRLTFFTNPTSGGSL